MTFGSNPDDSHTKPWSEWDRATKLETVKKLPELLGRISAEVDAHVSAAQEATATVGDVLKAIDRKGGE